jgi:hypothetical protein
VLPLLCLLLAPARADDGVTQSTAELRSPVAQHPVFELRAGVDARPGGPGEGPTRPYLCGELTPLKRVGIEACGNGAGVLQDEQLSDFAHFRARYTALQRQVGRWDLDVLAGVGWAEVQVGQDAAGFRFGEAQAGQVEAAGAEASASLKARAWLHERVYGTVDLNVGTAVIPGAPEVLSTPQGPGAGPVVPFGSITAGVGF